MAKNQFFIGIDIGGWKIKSILLEKRKILKRFQILTPKTRGEFLIALYRAIKEVLPKGEKISGLGAAVPGIIDRKKGKVIKSPNLPFLDGLNLKKLIKKKIKARVLLDNDANCFLRGESVLGSAKGIKNVVGITLGTGVGGAIKIAPREIYEGGSGSAGELGHMIIDIDGKTVKSLEDLVSARAIKQLTGIIPQYLREKAEKREPKALKDIEKIAYFLGIGLANIVNILDPEMIVIGGGLSNFRNLLLAPAEAAMKKLIISPRAQKVKIVFSKLREEAGAIGAALLFQETDV